MTLDDLRAMCAERNWHVVVETVDDPMDARAIAASLDRLAASSHVQPGFGDIDHVLLVTVTDAHGARYIGLTRDCKNWSQDPRILTPTGCDELRPLRRLSAWKRIDELAAFCNCSTRTDAGD